MNIDTLKERDFLIALRKKLNSGPTAAMGNMWAAAMILGRLEEIEAEEKQFVDDHA